MKETLDPRALLRRQYIAIWIDIAVPLAILMVDEVNVYVPMVLLLLASRIMSGGSTLRSVVARFGLLGIGVAIGTSFWYGMAIATSGGVVSFLWISFPGPMLMLIIGYGSIPFLPRPADSEHAGLTLWSRGNFVDTSKEPSKVIAPIVEIAAT